MALGIVMIIKTKRNSKRNNKNKSGDDTGILIRPPIDQIPPEGANNPYSPYEVPEIPESPLILRPLIPSSPENTPKNIENTQLTKLQDHINGATANFNWTVYLQNKLGEGKVKDLFIKSKFL